MANYNKQGTVSMYSERPWEDRDTGENIILYSFQLQGDKRYYRCGTTPPGVREGDNVQFVCDGKGTVDLSTLVKNQPTQGGAPVAQAPATGNTSRPASARPSGGNSRDQYWADKEKRDLEKDERYQNVDIPRMVFANSQGHAARIVAAALDNDALSFGNVQKGKKIDMLMDYVDQVTIKLAQDQMRAHEILAETKASDWSFGDELAQEQQQDLGDE